MPSFVNKKTVLGAITGGLLILGGPTGIDLAFEDSIKITPTEERISIYDSHIKEHGDYEVEAKDFAGRDEAVKYCDYQGCISFTPSSIGWDTGSLIQRETSILSDREQKEKGLKYASVFGAGIDMDIDVSRTRFSKVLTIGSALDLGAVPRDAKTLDVYFEITSTYEIEDGPLGSGLQLSEFSRMLEAKVWGDAEQKDTQLQKTPITADIVTIDDRRYLVKHIPVDFLKKAQYPIHTDVDITYSTAYGFTSVAIPNPYEVRMAELGSNKFVTCFYNPTGEVADCLIGTETDGVISYGASTTVTANDSLVAHGHNPNIAVCKVNTDKFAFIYSDDVLADDGYVRIGSVSGTAITMGTALEFETTDMESPSCAQIASDKIIIAYNDETPNSLQARACTISGTTPTCGTIATLHASIEPDHVSVSQMDTDKFVVGYVGDTTLGYYVVVGTVSGTTITGGTPVTVTARPSNNNGDLIQVVGMGTNNFAGTFTLTTPSPDEAWAFAGTTTGATIGGIASSTTAIETSANSYETGGLVKYDSDTYLIFATDFESVVTFINAHTRFVDVNFTNLSQTWTEKDEVLNDARFQDEYAGDIVLLNSLTPVVCYTDSGASIFGFCKAGAITPQVETGVASGIASTTATLSGYATSTYNVPITTGFVYGIDDTFTATSTPYTATTSAVTLNTTLTSLSTFEEYAWKAYATTTDITLYGDTRHFFTADISTSTPVVEADNHDWDLSTFDNGTHATTTTAVDTSLRLQRVEGSATTSTTTYLTVNLADAGFCYTDGSCFTGEVSGNARMGFRSGAGFGPIVTGFRFPDITLDQGQTVLSATFTYTAQDTDATEDPVIISAEDTDSSPIFSTTGDDRPLTPFYGGLRATTTANASWTLPNQTVGVQYDSPDITSVVQEVIDRSGWLAGNALSILVTDNGATDNHNADIQPAGLNELSIVTEYSYTNGYWIAPAWDIGSITNVGDSWIEYASTTPSDTSVLVRTAVSTSSTTPPSEGSFATSTSGGSIAGISTSDDLTGKYLWVRVDLYASSDQAHTPTLEYITYAINQGSDAPPAGRRRILHTMLPVDLYRDERELSMLY